MSHSKKPDPAHANFYCNVACNLIYYRTLRHLSQREFAAKVKCTPKYISMLENPYPLTSCSLEMLFCLASALEIEPYQLLAPKQQR